MLQKMVIKHKAEKRRLQTMDKINEIKNKLEVRACNPNLRMERQVALDALNVITEQESEIARNAMEW